MALADAPFLLGKPNSVSANGNERWDPHPSSPICLYSGRRCLDARYTLIYEVVQ